jgi:hypothetical protein
MYTKNFSVNNVKSRHLFEIPNVDGHNFKVTLEIALDLAYLDQGPLMGTYNKVTLRS